MQAADIPARLPVPFAYAAGGSYVRTVPIPSQIGITPGAASYHDGFVPLNFIELGAGGIPPDGRDINGVLFAISAWASWRSAGGPVGFDQTFADAIGGYPEGALINKASGVGYWYCLADDNADDPDAGGADWASIGFGTTYAGNPNGHVAGVAVSSNSISGSQLWDTTNGQLWICTSTGPASGMGQAVWVGIVGTVTAVGVVTANGFGGSSSGGATPQLILTTDVTGLLKGNGTGMIAATPGSDYVTPAQFGASGTVNGFQQLPSGIMFQWGLTDPVPTGSGGLTVTFPTAFPFACFSIIAQFTNSLTPSTAKDMASNVSDPALSNTSFLITQQSGASSQYNWWAIGR